MVFVYILYMLSIYLVYTDFIKGRLPYSLCIYLIYAPTNKSFSYHNIFFIIDILQLYIYIQHMHRIFSICGYQYVFCIAKSVVPPTFSRRSISDHVQLFCDHAQLHPKGVRGLPLRTSQGDRNNIPYTQTPPDTVSIAEYLEICSSLSLLMARVMYGILLPATTLR